MKLLKRHANKIAHLCWFTALFTAAYIIHQQNISLYYLAEATDFVFDAYVKCVLGVR